MLQEMGIVNHQPLPLTAGAQTQGLYDASHEHDACGVGMVVNIHGNKSHELVDNALKVLENMRHRGAEGADGRTGDGAGIMLQIPHEFILLQGIPVPEKGKYGTGLVFLPKDPVRQQAILSIMIEEIEREGLQLMHLRNVPTNPSCLGEAALSTEPDIKQMFITGVTDDKLATFERTLYIIRKKIERRVNDSDFYVCSLSSKNIIYKGMLSSMQVRQYFPDLTNNYFTSGLALVHSRFSTNTFPTWSLAQPFRLLAHHGEINTIRGNRSWMKARESVLSSETLGDIRDISPIIQPGMSDSASLDNVFERFPRLKERHRQIAGTLSGGEQQMLAMGRALMSKPRLLMLDEPSMGLAPLLVEQIFDIIGELNRAGTTILLVEQNAQMALSIANRAYVLETGNIVKSGDAHLLMNDDDVRKAYLG